MSQEQIQPATPRASRLARWRSLAWDERRWLLLCLLLLPLMRLALRWFGLRRTQLWLEQRYPEVADSAPDAQQLAKVQARAHLAAIAGRRGPIAATCLPQALLIYASLRRMGLRPLLQIGMRKQGERFDAHAWVELGGQALGQASLEHRAFAGLHAAGPAGSAVEPPHR